MVLPRPVAGPWLPAAPGQPGATERPELVGTDPAVVHFTADDLIADARYATWTTGRGTESVQFHGGSTQARFVLARSAATLDGIRQTLASSGRPEPASEVRVNDRPGTAWFDPAPSGGPGLWFVRWQPGDGLWARLDIYAGGRDEAVRAAGRVRLDDAHRCAVPFRLQSLPAGARLLECSVNLELSGSGAFAEGALVVGDEAGRWLTVRAQRVPGGAGRRGGTVLQRSVPPCEVEVFLKGWGDGYPESDGRTVLAGYRPADDFDDPSTW
jgi:hypothetical protein